MSIIRPQSGWKLVRKPTSPGEMLLKEFMEPLHLTQKPRAEAARTCHAHRGDYPRSPGGDTGDGGSVGIAFGTSPQFWLNLQQNCDIDEVEQDKAKIEHEVERIVNGEAFA
jgi:plasmid maintenance system antidote protein VapI